MPLEKLDLPAILRASAELIDTTTSYRPEDHTEVLAAQADPAKAPEPSVETRLRWHDALDAILEAANRLKVALGATGELRPGRARESNLPAIWEHFDSDFVNVDHPRAARFGLLRIARAAVELSGYARRKRPPTHMRECGLSFLERGARLVWPALTAHERDEVRHLLPTFRSAFSWSGAADDLPPVWAGALELDDAESYGMWDRPGGYYANTCDDLEEQQAVFAALTSANNKPPATADAKGKPRGKRSTQRGEARAKLIAALTKHHHYADGGALHLEPIGNNELARLADVDISTASAFFEKQFNGHDLYKKQCTDAAKLAFALKLLNGEVAPHTVLTDSGQFADADD